MLRPSWLAHIPRSWRPRSPLHCRSLMPLLQHRADTFLGFPGAKGKHRVMQGCTFPLLPRCTRNKGHGCRKSTHGSSSNFSVPLQFLGLVGTQAQAKIVPRLFLFKSQISKEKCFNPLHLTEGQGWNSAGKHDLSYLSFFLIARALPSGSWLEAITGSSCSVRLSVWIPRLWEPQPVDASFNPSCSVQIKALFLAITTVSSQFLSGQCQPVL